MPDAFGPNMTGIDMDARPLAAWPLVALGLLAGCASSSSGGWAKPGATEEHVNRDSADCLAAAQSMAPGRDGPRMVVNQDRYRQCMANRGYTAGPAQ